MKQFRFETEVELTVVNEYFIEADSLEEALSQLQNGEYRGEGIVVTENFHWGTEVIKENATRVVLNQSLF